MFHHISNSFLDITISEQGAEMMSIQNKAGIEFLWQGDKTYWSNRAMNLFPYIARLTQGCYRYQGKLYHLPIHGFAPTATYKAIQNAEDHITFTLKNSENYYENYPFLFTFSISYQLIENTLRVQYTVENKDHREMIFALGGHPGFNVPMESGLTFNDYKLTFSSDSLKRVEFSDDCFVTGEETPFPLEEKSYSLHHGMFDHDAIVLTNVPEHVCLHSDKGNNTITLIAPDFPFWGFWHTPRTEAPFLCMEPWSALPSRQGRIEDLETQKHLTHLSPGKRRERSWMLRFDGLH